MSEKEEKKEEIEQLPNIRARISGQSAPQIFVHQADAVLSQANPVSGTKYEVLATTKNVRIIAIWVKTTWSVQPTPLEIHVTIDGQTLTFSQTNPVSGTNYYAFIHEGYGPTAQIFSTSGKGETRAFLLEGRSVKVEAEITGGTVSALDARVVYAKIP